MPAQVSSWRLLLVTFANFGSSRDRQQHQGPQGFGGSGGGGGGPPAADGAKLFVGGLSWNTDDRSLGAAFSALGAVVEARVVMDRDDPGRSRGFGFVTYQDAATAAEAVRQMDGQNLDGRNIRVNVSDGGRGGGGGGGGIVVVSHCVAPHAGPPATLCL